MRMFSVLISICLLWGVIADRCEDEVPIPSKLPLEQHGGEYHLHGHYRVPLNESRFVAFKLSQESFFRAYVGGHEIVDIDLYLLNGTGNFVAFSIEFNSEEMIAQVLKPGDYKLEITPFTTDSNGNQDLLKYECQFAQIEIAVTPVSVVKQRESTYHFGEQKVPEAFDLSGLSDGRAFNYHPISNARDPPFNTKIAYNFTRGANPLTIVAKYPLKLVPKPGSNPLFKFTATLGYNFLTAGSLRILVEPANETYTGTTPQCLTDAFRDNCFQGVNEGQNVNVISTVLGSGSYTLWIFDRTGNRLPRQDVVNDGFSFSLHIAQLHSDETFVSCDALPLPKNWNQPGLIDDTGYLSFREQILLDIEAKEETAHFTLPYPSLFRAWSEAHRVDIDFQLKRGETVIGRTYRGARQEESMLMKLEANTTYTFLIKYYSAAQEQFCEKIWMEIMIQPLTPYYSLNHCAGKSSTSPVVPDLTNIQQAYQFPAQTYYYTWRTTDHTERITTVRIRPTKDMFLAANLETQFLDGLYVGLRSVNVSLTRTFTTVSGRGYQRVTGILTAGRVYELTLQGGPHQFNPRLDAFPRCALFKFEFSLEPFSIGSGLGMIRPCPWHPTLPVDLTGPANFATSNRVHFQDFFAVPHSTGFESKHTLSFTVRQRSLLRAYTEPRKGDDVDVDFVLYEDNINLNHTVKEYDEEKITQILVPGKRYKFEFWFFTDFSVGNCHTFNLEFEIAPIHPVDTAPCAPVLPPTNPIPIRYLVREWVSEEVYKFQQTKNAFVRQIPLQILTRSAVYARFLIAFDFIWNDLSIRIKDRDGHTIALGDNDFNKNQILALRLPTGNYTIEIFEPAALTDEELHHCSDFLLNIGIAPPHEDMFPDTSVVTEDEDEPDCQKLFLPPTWNDISYLSHLSDYTFHSAGMVRIHGDRNAETVAFSLQQQSILRIYVPAWEVFDVDIYIWLVKDGGNREQKGRSTAYRGDEQIYLELPAGNYQAEFRLFFVPKDKPCLAFPAELGIISNSRLNTYKIQQPQTVCNSDTTRIEDQLVIGRPYSRAMTRTSTTTRYFLKSSFQVARPSLFTARLDYPFFTGHLDLNINGKNIQSPYLSAPSERALTAFIGQDTAFFDVVLYPGEYTLEIEDEVTNYTQRFCNQFNLAYELFPGYVPENYCDDADTLPSDVNSYRGRSRFYGGPQKLDGSVHISGKHFLLPDHKSHNNILFNIKSPSFVRIWAKFEDAKNNDVDFLIWKNESKRNLISASYGSEAVESHALFLLPQADAYVLDVFVYARSIRECHFLHFEFVIETNQSIMEDMLCPVPLPSPLLPPSEVHINSPEFLFYGDTFVFTNEYIQANKQTRFYYDEVTYKIAIHIEDDYRYEISTAVGFNFVWSDYTVELWKGSLKKAESIGDLAISQDAWDDFRSVLEASMERGDYELRIIEKIYAKEAKANIAGTCEKFTFALNIERVGDPGNSTFRVVTVTPPSARELSVENYLTLEILFSNTLGDNAHANDVLDWIKTSNAVFLSQAFRRLNPVLASWNRQLTLLTVTFVGLKIRETWNLNITSSAFKNAEGVSLAPYNQIHTYSTLSCDCHGRGTCAASNETRPGCVCNSPYAGRDCTLCVIGYHRVGTECVQDTACTANSCNGHGTCSDSLGYPICECHKGYDSTGAANGACAICHVGYSGYPNCKPQDDSRALHCEAPLLPGTLDSVAYLAVDGQLHLQGDYYLDVNHFGHDMKFTIERDSFFRVYTEPHDVDIDLWLFKQDGNVEVVVSYAISFNDEETMFLKLSPGVYRLAFQFLVFREYTACPTFNLELAIEPVNDFVNLVNKYRGVCKATDNLPQIPMPGSSVPTNGPWEYAPATIFTVNARDLDVGNRTFYTFDFSVPRILHRDVAFEVDLGYRFMTGDIASRLEEKIHDQWESVGTGYNGYNQHYLRHNLDEGTYRLILYLPAAVNKSDSPCSPFTLAIHTRWIVRDEDVFNCDFSEIPETLDSVTLRGERDHITISDEFLIQEWDDSTIFTVPGPSAIRIFASAPVLFHYQLEKQIGGAGSENWEVVQRDVDDELFNDSLTSGITYRIRFQFTYFSSQTFCPTLRLTINVVSREDFAEPFVGLVCTGRQSNANPQLPTGHISLPYEYNGRQGNSEIDFYAFKEFGVVVGSWRVYFSDNTYFSASVGSDFMASNMQIRLTTDTRQITSSVKTTMHESTIEAELRPGNYTITLVQAPRTLGSPACTPYSFKLKAVALAQWRQDPCNGKGVDLPTSFNSLRYSGGRNEIQLVSDKWKMPTELNTSTFVISKQISLDVKKESLLRLYIGVHVVDIDVALYATNNPSVSLARGADLMGEESFIVKLLPGSYFVRLLFWNLGGQVPNCPTFNMQIVMEEVEDLPTRKKLCTQGNSAPEKWPTLPRAISEADLPFQHSYTGFYQQVDHNDFNHSIKSYSIDFGTSVDLHIETGYNFLLGDLVITLTNGEGTVVHGINKATRNILNAKALPRGTYTLSIHEATQNHKDFIGCSDFTLSLLIAKADTSDARDEVIGIPFPKTFDGIEYLMFSDEVHIHEQKYLLDIGGIIRRTPTLSINVQVPSLLRVATGILDPITLSMGGADEPRVRDLIVKLPEGRHNVTFHLQDFRLSRYLLVNLQVALEPIVGAETYLREQCSVQRGIWNPPKIDIRPSDGLYQYNEYRARMTGDHLQSSSIDSKLFILPFEITRESIVSVQVLYQFITGHLTLQLSDAYSQRHGIADWNMNDLNALLLPGKFNLTIVRPQLFPASILPINCGEFGLRISISPKESKQDRVDCSDAALFPWDFNSDSGGSSMWGGPMASGSLNVWGSRFLLNGGSGNLRAKFTTETPSIVALFVHQHAWSRLNLQVLDGNTQQFIIGTARQTNFFQTLASYKLTNTAKHDYAVQVAYQPSEWQACSTFTFAIAVHPLNETLEYLKNTCSRGPQVQLPTKITKSPVEVNSYFTGQDLTQHTRDGLTFQYEMEFTITQDSALDISLAFNPLVSSYTMRLLQRPNATTPYSSYIRGEWTPVEGSASELTQIIDADLRAELAKDYKLVITQPSSVQGQFTSPGATLCYPFSFLFQLEKLDGRDSAFVRYVDPPSGDRFDPRRDIQVDMRFSHALHDSENHPITRSEDGGVYMANSIELVPVSGPGHTTVRPVKASAPPSNPSPDDLTRWSFQFPHDTLAHGTSYKLSLVPRRLFAPDRAEMRLAASITYAMSPENEACGKYGHWNGKICVCDGASHRVGPTCGECEAGFILDETQKCVRPGACEERTCGCLPTSTPSHCSPIGTCSVNSENKIVCLCPPAYNGLRCERCAPGFLNKSGVCAKDCNPPCQSGGICNPDSGKCTCVGNFMGPACDTCKPGFMGANCDAESGSILVKVVGILLGALVLIILVAVFAWYWRMRTGSQYEQLGDLGDDFMDGMSGGKGGSIQLDPLGSDGSDSASAEDPNEIEFSESKSD